MRLGCLRNDQNVVQFTVALCIRQTRTADADADGGGQTADVDADVGADGGRGLCVFGGLCVDIIIIRLLIGTPMVIFAV